MQSLIAALFTAAFVFIQCYISGSRLAYALPAYVVIGLAAVLAIFSRSEGRRQISRLCMVATTLCFSYLLWRGWQSPVEYVARTDMYSIVACLAVYGITTTCVTDRRLRAAILCVMLGLTVVEAMMGAYQYSGNPNWLPFQLVHRPSLLRGRGSFISSIHFAGYLEAIAPFGLAIAFWGSRTLWVRIMAGATAVLCYFAVGLSGSRGAWLSSVFSLLVFAGISLNASRKIRSARFAAAIYLTTLAFVALPGAIYYLMQQSTGVRERLELLGKISERKINDYDIRILNWEAAIDQWKQSPWLGTGAGTHLYYGRLYRRPGLQPDPVHAHSDYLELIAEYGNAGAIAIGLFLVAHLVAGFRAQGRLLAIRRDDPYRPLPELCYNIGALTAVSAYFAHSVVDFNLHLPGNALLFAFIFGLLASPNVPNDREEDVADERGRFEAVSWPWRLVTPALGAVLIGLFVVRMPAEYWESRARIALRERRYDDGVSLARLALQTDQKNPFIYLDLGQALRFKAATVKINDDLLREAAQAFRAGLQLSPQEETLWIRLGQTLDDLGEFAEAKTAYEKALALDPNLGVLYGYYARHLKLVGRLDEAKAAHERGQALGGSGFAAFAEDLAPEKDELSDISARPR